MKHINYISAFALVGLLLSGCTVEKIDEIVSDSEIISGENVQFTTLLPEIDTKSAKDDWTSNVSKYRPSTLSYNYTVSMYKEGVAEAIGAYDYRPDLATTSFEEGESVVPSDYDGTLRPTSVGKLLWEDNVNKYGFRAVANQNELLSDQSSSEKWFNMDYIEGHSYVPVWTGTDESGEGSDPDVMQYMTSKEWYNANKDYYQGNGIMVSSASQYKKIPLYMKHKRSWITIILKAGEGVSRDALKYSTSSENIRLSLYSYAPGSSTPFEVNLPLSKETFINYQKDKNGAAQNDVSTTRYDAIVEPHNYALKKDDEVISTIVLSDQKFSFYASNDSRYVNGTEEEKAIADQAYNLSEGKHLTITATLSRDSRKILITAWVEDWTDNVTSTICDDYGQNGDPIVIKNRKELIQFLNDPKRNKQGNVAIIQPGELDLEKDIDGNPSPWDTPYPLNATLNLACCKISTAHQIFSDLASTSSLVNGVIEVVDGAEVPYVLAETNNGTIERVDVQVSGELSTARATVAGLVGTNRGTIYQCTSTLPVYGPDSDGQTYVGGIAAINESLQSSLAAVIDECFVNASVNGGENVKGGGIVGYATGRVTNNTFEYGMTVSQSAVAFKNIFAQAGGTQLVASNNGWPTVVENPISESEPSSNENRYAGVRYRGVIDCQKDLHTVMIDATLNDRSNTFRIANSFTVLSSNDPETDWFHGTVAPDNLSPSQNNVSFSIEGNGKTIYLDGDKVVKTTDGTGLDNGEITTYTTAPMLFNYVFGKISNLTVYLKKPIVASPSLENGAYNASDAIASLAYAVYGPDARLSNINVKSDSDTFVQSSTPAGLVVWAWGGSTLIDCKVKVNVRMWLPKSMGQDSKHYAGGIVACAARSTITRCSYLGNSEDSVTGSEYSSSANSSQNYFYGGIVGGTSIKNTEEPLLQITDCVSWFLAQRDNGEGSNRSSRGSIIAYTAYATTGASSSVANGMNLEHPSEGNWWPESTVGAHTWANGLSEEKVIGKKNVVRPEYETNF
ncbi:MAG: fimbrillin family protein [Bacteroidales bacterium]|nr:fimbrillin family protein [Bacteroidales bacterium]